MVDFSGKRPAGQRAVMFRKNIDLNTKKLQRILNLIFQNHACFSVFYQSSHHFHWLRVAQKNGWLCSIWLFLGFARSEIAFTHEFISSVSCHDVLLLSYVFLVMHILCSPSLSLSVQTFTTQRTQLHVSLSVIHRHFQIWHNFRLFLSWRQAY